MPIKLPSIFVQAFAETLSFGQIGTTTPVAISRDPVTAYAASVKFVATPTQVRLEPEVP